MLPATRSTLTQLIGLIGLLGAGAVCAQSVSLVGILGSKALLIVDGSAPKSVASGETFAGVKVLAVRSAQADVEIQGDRQTLRLGEGPVQSASTEAPGNASKRVVLYASTNGHFRSPGQINGRAVNFMVDTGASAVGMSVQDAQRIGLKYEEGEPMMVNTANGSAPAYRLKLDRVRLGTVEVFGVEAIVSPAPMPYVLLGNSFLSRFSMTRVNDEMVLEQRY